MNVYRRFFPAHLRFLMMVHLILLLIFSTFRYITLLYNRPTYFFQVDRTLPLGEAFRIGLGFDITVACYALLLPYLLLTYAFIRPKEHARLFRFVRNWCGAAILISLLICAADLPYFNFFNSRLHSAAVQWKNILQSTKYIFSEIKYYPVIVFGVFCIWGIGRFMRMLWNRSWSAGDYSGRSKIMATGLASLMMLVGIWGGATPKAPTMERATFSNDGFINQLTLNPVLTWFDSYFEFDLQPFTLKEAAARVQKYLGVRKALPESPIARLREFDAEAGRQNVVLILLESMTAGRMGIFGDSLDLTPGLDSLARNSVFFDNCYSNGIHTNAGLYSTLYGMPIRMMQHPMNNGVSEKVPFSGLPVTLREAGYNTAFFCTHPKSFDNLDVFLEKNGYDYISDVYDYPKEKVANSWGVGDESLYEFALQKMDSLDSAAGDRPFFGTILTITSHPPYTLPAFTKFKARRKDPVEITYEYADWALTNFMKACAEKPWYNNTVFVLVGDHGSNLPSPYDVPLSYNHVPLIVHAPGLFKKPEIRHQLANQTDIFPTVMGLLQEDYVQNTMGYDLFREKRPFVLFSQDQKMGVLNENYLYVARKSGKETLYDYRKGDTEDYLAAFPALADSMRAFACAHLHVAHSMIQKKQVGFIPFGAK
jgi:phosphoglycerol transferase MdoB-like AlkP superfamily enzyme